MIRFRFKELLAEKAFQERRVITMGEVAEATGIHRTTLSKISNIPGYVARTDAVDKLCSYFSCGVGDLMSHLPDQSARSKDPRGLPDNQNTSPRD